MVRNVSRFELGLERVKLTLQQKPRQKSYLIQGVVVSLAASKTSDFENPCRVSSKYILYTEIDTKLLSVPVLTALNLT